MNNPPQRRDPLRHRVRARAESLVRKRLPTGESSDRRRVEERAKRGLERLRIVGGGDDGNDRCVGPQREAGDQRRCGHGGRNDVFRARRWDRVEQRCERARVVDHKASRACQKSGKTGGTHPKRARQSGCYGGRMVDRAALPTLEHAGVVDLVSDAVLDGVEVAGLDLSGIRAARMRLLETAVVDCSADELDTAGLSAVDTFVGDMHLQTWKTQDSTWRDGHFAGMRVGAWLADGTEFIDVVLRDSKVDLLSLRGARITRLTIANCTIETLDVTEAQIADLTITGGAIGELVTANARMSNVEVSATELHLVSDPSYLRGLVISTTQLVDLAPVFAAHMGIAVKEGA